MRLTRLQIKPAFVAIAAATVLITPMTSKASNNWDGGGGSNWWFDPINWGQDEFMYLPPGQDSGGSLVETDAQVNSGSGAWDVTGEGVVYDPDNDPFFAAAAGLSYPTGASFFESDFGPEHLYRLYVSRNTTNDNRITIKSGDLVIESTVIIGRSGSVTGSENSGRIDQLGGRVRFPTNNVEIGSSEDSGWGNGFYNHQGGVLEIGQFGPAALRLAHGRSSGPSGVNRFIVGNESPGRIRVHNFQMISYRGSADGVFTEGQDPNGVDRGVAIVEFELENGATRPVQVVNQLTLNNGFEINTGATLSSRLDLTLNEAPTVDGLGVPINLGLFDVDFDNGLPFDGVINGFGDIDNDEATDKVLASEDGSEYYLEGSTVSAVFGNTRYDWSISYTGDITWSDADNGVVGSIAGAGSGTDVVLMGLGSEVLAGIAGDYNSDGVVDAIDYAVWRDGGAPDSSEAGYTLWASNYGATAAVSVAVPEPTALVSILSVCIAVVSRRRV